MIGTAETGTAETWRGLFTEWPAGLPRQGVIVNSLNEQTPFKNFWLRDQLLLLERTVPDANGGRFVLLTFDVINTVKLTAPLNNAAIAAARFEGAELPLSERFRRGAH